MLPNFLIAGGVASGTSFLSASLSHHPDIYLPRVQRPEPNFFHYSWKFNQGMGWYQKTWFHEVGDQKAVGERSSLLLTSDVAAKRIKETLPDVKLIFCLRNPIERAWANYRFSVLEGLEPLSFKEAIESESDRMKQEEGKWAEVQPHAYLARSHYASHLLEFIELFGRDNILMLKSEALGEFPHEHLKMACEFLEIDSSIELPLPPNYSSPSVSDVAVQVQLRDYFGDRFSEVIELIRKEKDLATLDLSEEDQLNVDRLRTNLAGKKMPLSDADRQKLRNQLDNEISRVGSIVDFPVDDWV